MKLIIHIVLISTIFLVSNLSIAENRFKETLYHCPYISDIKFDKSRYSAHTHYNEKSINWDNNEFMPREIKIDAFTKAVVHCKNDRDCYVQCSYKLHNDDFIILEMLYGNMVTKIGNGNGNWNGKTCAANQPEQCEFYVSSRS